MPMQAGQPDSEHEHLNQPFKQFKRRLSLRNTNPGVGLMPEV